MWYSWCFDNLTFQSPHIYLKSLRIVYSFFFTGAVKKGNESMLFPQKEKLIIKENCGQKCLILPVIINIIPVKEVHFLSFLSSLKDHHKLQWISFYIMRRAHPGSTVLASLHCCPSPVLSCCLSIWNSLMSLLPALSEWKSLNAGWSLEWRERFISVEAGKRVQKGGVDCLPLLFILWFH